MKFLAAFFTFFMAVSAFGAFPPYTAFRGAGGIFVTTNPPNGLIIIDGTAISGSAAAGGSEGSVQYNVSGVVSGDTNFQYVLQTVEEFPQSAKLTIHLHGATNFMNASGFGTLSADELFLYSGGSTIGARKWGINAAGDLNPITDDASYNIGTIGLNRKPFYVGVQSAFNINDRITLSASGTIWQVGNHSSWIQGQILTDGAVRMHFLSGGNVGIGTVTPTAHLTVSNFSATTPPFAVYASNNPAPALIVNSNSFVGIGTNAPQSRLHVVPLVTGTSYLRVDHTNLTPRFRVGVYSGIEDLGAIYLGATTPSTANPVLLGDGNTATYINSPSVTTPLYFSQGTSIRYLIGSGGHLLANIDNTYGIGAPAANRPAYLHLGGGGAGTVGLTVGGTLYVTNGNVGVGTVAPIAYGGYKNVAINGTTGGIIDLMASGDVAGQFFANATEFRITAGTNRPFVVHTGVTSQQERFQVSAAGNVGIGTNAPSSRLHVRPATSGTSYFRVDDTNGTARLQFGVYPGLASLGTLWLGDVTPSAANMILAGDGSTSYLRANGTLNFQSAPGTVWVMNSAGHFIAGIDNTYDIGAAGATRPRNVFIAGSNIAHTVTVMPSSGVANLYLTSASGGQITSDVNMTLVTANGGSLFLSLASKRVQFNGTTAAFPALVQTNGHLGVISANGTIDGTSTNGLWVMGGPIIQDFTHTAPAAPSRQGAVYWNDGTNVCVVLRNSAGTLTTNKLSMTAWP